MDKDLFKLIKKRPERAEKKAAPPAPGKHPDPSPISQKEWFYTFMYMNIPIAGWLYLRRLAREDSPSLLKDFAKAYLHYKLVFLGIALALLAVLCVIGGIALDRLLAYMQML